MATWVVGFYSSDVSSIDECATYNVTLKEDKDDIIRVTASGYFEIIVEAGTKEEARYKAIIKLLKSRVEDLKRMYKDEYEGRQREVSIIKEQMKPLLENELKFSQMIRAGEVHICNTGSRILGSWFKDPKVSIEIPSNGKLGAIIKAFEEAYPEEECY